MQVSAEVPRRMTMIAHLEYQKIQHATRNPSKFLLLTFQMTRSLKTSFWFTPVKACALGVLSVSFLGYSLSH